MHVSFIIILILKIIFSLSSFFHAHRLRPPRKLCCVWNALSANTVNNHHWNVASISNWAATRSARDKWSNSKQEMANCFDSCFFFVYTPQNNKWEQEHNQHSYIKRKRFNKNYIKWLKKEEKNKTTNFTFCVWCSFVRWANVFVHVCVCLSVWLCLGAGCVCEIFFHVSDMLFSFQFLFKVWIEHRSDANREYSKCLIPF